MEMAPPPPPYDLVENKISPSILLIIVIVAIIFFVSGLLHLLVRYLLRPTILTRDPDDTEDAYNATAIQGQLQQLFHLHDAGVDQSLIDALPVFPYKSIVGRSLKDPFDCAVCLCEFDPDDKLRLLPNCSHAFHTDCIDTWLLTHSTCPLCRGTLLPADLSPAQCSSPLLLLLESPSESESFSFREIGGDIHDEEDEEETQSSSNIGEEKEANLVQVKLGKFRSVDAEGRSNVDIGGSNLADQRRCFSMGSYEYEMNDNNLLRVAIKPSTKKLQLDDGRKLRLAMSECDCHSRREGFRGISTSTTKRDSVNKFWLRSKKHDPAAATSSDNVPRSRRAFSFRLPSESKAKSAASEEYDVSSKWEKNGSDMDLDVEVGSCNNSVLSMGSHIEGVPSFARRTLLWIVGRHNRVGSMS